MIFFCSGVALKIPPAIPSEISQKNPSQISLKIIEENLRCIAPEIIHEFLQKFIQGFSDSA